MEEKWKQIKGFENKYEISNLGKVRSIGRYISGKNNSCRYRKGTILKPQIASGYAQVYLSDNGKQKWYKVHRLVAEAFIPNPNNLPIINHKDGNTLNNTETNIEWCNYKYNVIHGVILRKGLDISVNEYIEQQPLGQSYEKRKEYFKNRYEEKKEHIRETQKKYYQKNKEIILKKYHENKTCHYL